MSTTTITATESLELFEALKGCSNENDVKKILDNHPFTSNPQNWIPLGNNPSNAAMTQNTSGSPGAFISELITNAIDAYIIKRKKEAEEKGVIFPEDALKNPESILKFLNPEAFLNQESRRLFAKDIMGMVTTEYNVDEKTRTKTITIFDKGCGQKAENFKDTFCSVGFGQNNKANMPWLHGSYGQGSTAANSFSGEEGYKVIASRAPKNKNWAWTIIRRNPDKPSMLEYLIIDSNHNVLEFEAEHIELGYYCNNGALAPGVAKIEYGSMIKVYSVDIKKGWTELKKEIGSVLFRPAIPIQSLEFTYSKEGKTGEKQDYDPRWIDGFAKNIDGLVKEDKAETFNFQISVEKLGIVNGVAYFFENNKEESKKWLPTDNKGACVFHINNGQVQHKDLMSIIGKKYPSLKEHILIEMDLSKVDQNQAYARLFKADRLSFQTNTAMYKEYHEKLYEIISSSDVFYEWNLKVIKNKMAYVSSDSADDEASSCMEYLEKTFNLNNKTQKHEIVYIENVQEEEMLSNKLTGEFHQKSKKNKKADSLIEIKGTPYPTSFDEVSGELVFNKNSEKSKVAIKFKTNAKKGSLVGKDATGSAKIKSLKINHDSNGEKEYDTKHAILTLAEGKNNHIICNVDFHENFKKEFEHGDQIFVEVELTAVDQDTNEIKTYSKIKPIKVVLQPIENKDAKGKKALPTTKMFSLKSATLTGKIIDNKVVDQLPDDYDKNLGWNVIFNGSGFMVQINMDNPKLQSYLIEKKYLDYKDWIVSKLYKLIGISMLGNYETWIMENSLENIGLFQEEANEKNYGLKTINSILFQIKVELDEMKKEK